MNKINKNELIKKLNSYNIIEINEELEDNIGFYKIIFGEFYLPFILPKRLSDH